MTTLFVKRLTVLDFSYLHTERGLLGESWILDIALTGALNAQGMVLDFSDVKRQVKQLVDDAFDHKLLVPAQSRQLERDDTPEQASLTFNWGEHYKLVHRSPASAVCYLATDKITPTSVAAALQERLRSLLPTTISSIAVSLRNEDEDGAFYHYSHGLKHHSGNCQRIAHGHRSQLRILRNGIRDIYLEEDWAERWRDIYIGTLRDLVSTDDDMHHYCYSASQGAYELSLPAVCCDLIEQDSTIENIAQHIATQLKIAHPKDSFTVHAFEGIDKGAIGLS
jgi:6-pyruvoyl-tetrahydropterin synthase